MKKFFSLLAMILIAGMSFAQNNLAKAEVYGGVYVFMDCTPVSEYEVLGEVSFGGKGSGGTLISMPSATGGQMMMVSSGSTPQYTSIRNGLISNAVLANRAVEGIINANQ